MDISHFLALTPIYNKLERVFSAFDKSFIYSRKPFSPSNMAPSPRENS